MKREKITLDESMKILNLERPQMYQNSVEEVCDVLDLSVRMRAANAS